MGLLTCVGAMLLVAGVTSLPTQDTTATLTITDRPFKPSVQLSTVLERSKGVPEEDKDKQVLENQLGTGISDVNARSFRVGVPALTSIVGQPPPYRFYSPPRPVEGPHTHHDQVKPAVKPTLKPTTHLNYLQQYSSSLGEHGKSVIAAQPTSQPKQQQSSSLGDEEKPAVQTTLESTQYPNYLTPYQHTKTTIPPSLLAMAVANSPYFNSRGNPGSPVTPQALLSRYLPQPAMFQGMPGCSPFLPPSPLPQGIFGAGTSQPMPVIVLRVGENHQMLGMNLFMLQPQYSPNLMPQPHNYPTPMPQSQYYPYPMPPPQNYPTSVLPPQYYPYPMPQPQYQQNPLHLLAQLQNMNPSQHHNLLQDPHQNQLKLAPNPDDNTSNLPTALNIHAGLPPSDHSQYKNPSLPTPQAERLQTEAIMSPLQHSGHPYGYEDFMEKAK